MAADPVGVFSALVAWCKIRNICIDNNLFRLHYRVTVLMLLAFFLTITTSQFISDRIKCFGSENIPKEVFDNFCWMRGTRTVKTHLTGKIGKHMALPGVGPDVPGEDIYHNYYQWVYFVLLLQALFFYIPHIVWKIFEGHKVKELTEKLNSAMTPEEWSLEKRLKLAKYLINVNIYTKNFYAYQYAFCELLNFLNAIGQFFMLNMFFGYRFANYGILFIKYQSDDWDPLLASPMDTLFPPASKCDYYYYGNSGTVQTLSLMCILPLNVINQKIFLFLWFWLIFLSIVSAFSLIYRVLVFMCPCIRAYSLIIQAKLVPKYHIYNIVNDFSFSNWFMLNQMGKNMNIFVYKDLITTIGEELERFRKVEFV